MLSVFLLFMLVLPISIPSDLASCVCWIYSFAVYFIVIISEVEKVRQSS